MMIFTADYQMSDEVARAVRVIAPATAYFVRNLAQIVDITQLSEGDEEFDYFVRVPVNRLNEIDLRVADLKFDVQERFGVKITIMPIPVAA